MIIMGNKVELPPLLQGVQLTASIVAGCSTHPLDLIKVRMQLHGESVAVPNPNLRPAFAYSGTVAMPQPPPALARAGPVSVGVKIFQTEGVAALAGGIGAAVGNLADVAMGRTGTRLVVRTWGCGGLPRRRRGLSRAKSSAVSDEVGGTKCKPSTNMRVQSVEFRGCVCDGRKTLAF
ncbi:hypothetical protein R6Q57_010414 [Mikania cordata]